MIENPKKLFRNNFITWLVIFEIIVFAATGSPNPLGFTQASTWVIVICSIILGIAALSFLAWVFWPSEKRDSDVDPKRRCPSHPNVPIGGSECYIYGQPIMHKCGQWWHQKCLERNLVTNGNANRCDSCPPDDVFEMPDYLRNTDQRRRY